MKREHGHGRGAGVAGLVAAACVCLAGLLGGPAAAAQDLPAALARVVTRGEGPVPVVLLPGLGMNASVYDGFMRRNAGSYTMHAVTLRGFEPGAEPVDLGSFGRGASKLDGIVAGVAELARSRGLRDAVAIGHSMSGHLAMRLAAEHPDVFAGAVSLDGRPAYDAPGLDRDASPAQRAEHARAVLAPEIIAAPDAEWVEQWRRTVRSMPKDPAVGRRLGDVVAGLPAANTKRFYLELIAMDARPALGGLERPVLVVAPAESPSGQTPAEHRAAWDRLVGGLPGVRVEYFEGTGHFLFLDHPDEVEGAIRDFIEELSRGEP